jgi:hypothetical protein
MSSDSNYLKPKVSVGKIGERKRLRGEFVNVPGYVKLGGFSSAEKVPGQDPGMVLEKSPMARKGKPI